LNAAHQFSRFYRRSTQAATAIGNRERDEQDQEFLHPGRDPSHPKGVRRASEFPRVIPKAVAVVGVATPRFTG
jgi:hypothetical protein